MSNETIFESAGRLFFSRERVKTLEKELNIAGINVPADSFAGYVSLNVIVISAILTLLVLLYQPAMDFVNTATKSYIELPVFVIGAVIFGLSLVLAYILTMMLISSYILMKADDRRDKLEAVLPDFLTLVASNIKAGMALDQAMWYSAKPEFGLLSKEVMTVVKSSFSGDSLASTLDRLGSRFDSKVFKRTIMLLKQATATGGKLTDILEHTADDVRNTIIMKKEIAASLVLYEIFVLFAAVVGTPFLFAVASKLIAVFEKIGPQAGGAAGASGGMFTTFSSMKFSGAVISSADFFWFSVPTILVTALVSSFIVSIIRTGSKNQGIKYFPFVLASSYLVYWIVINVVDTIFATIG